jgi:hypothetical protein
MMFWHKKNAKVLLFLLLVPACGDNSNGFHVSGDALPRTVPDQTVNEDDYVIDTSSEVPATKDSLWVDSVGGKIYAESYRPADCTSASPCQAVVLVPDGLDGSEQFDCCAEAMAEKMHAIVITFNPPGRGIPGEESDGDEDFGGSLAQDALKDVANTFEKRSEIDGSHFGFVSFGFGLSTAAGALARFQSTSLSFVTWLIDVEGPTNRCFASQSPFYVHPDIEGYFVNEDGPGVSTTRCDFDLYLRTLVFPSGTSADGKGTNGTPNSYVCNENGFVLREAGKKCNDDQWWAGREAKNQLNKLTVHYLRLQFLHDHIQPTRYNAREALHWISQADNASYQLNNVTLNNNLKGYSDEDLVDAGAYLTFDAGNGYGTEIYDDNGDFDQLSEGQFYVGIIPQYVSRMQKRAAK